MEEVIECVKNADILKPAKSAADELLTVLGSGNTNQYVYAWLKWGVNN